MIKSPEYEIVGTGYLILIIQKLGNLIFKQHTLIQAPGRGPFQAVRQHDNDD